MSLELRKATLKDVDLIFNWANDPVVRKNSFNSEPISYSSHCQWFEKKISSQVVGFYILENDNEPVGQLRYEIENGIAITSYSISSSHRGKGLGKAIIELGEGKLCLDFPQVNKIYAFVKKENLASAIVFRRLEYLEIDDGDDIKFEKVINK